MFGVWCLALGEWDFGIHCLVFGVWCLGPGVWGSGIRDLGYMKHTHVHEFEGDEARVCRGLLSGPGVGGAECRVQGSVVFGCRVQGSGVEFSYVQASGFRG